MSREESSIVDAISGPPRVMDVAALVGVSPANTSRALARPGVQAEIMRRETDRLFRDALPAAVDCLVSIITNAKAPAGARVMASKVILDRTLGAEGAGSGREPHEMTADELAAEIRKFEAIAGDRAQNVTPAKADSAQGKPDLFG